MFEGYGRDHSVYDGCGFALPKEARAEVAPDHGCIFVYRKYPASEALPKLFQP